MHHPTLETPRLVLREWRDTDRDAFARLNRDPRVMRYFPAPLSRAQSDAFVDSIRAHFAREGYGLWAVHLRIGETEAETSDRRTIAHSDPRPAIGYTGLNKATFAAHFTPAVEIAWRLAADYHGRGYATEAARAALAYAFRELRLPEVVSFTSVENTPSRRVMEKIGLIHTPPGDFEHPALPPGHWLRRHVLYRLGNPVRP
ncbi:MAG: GNAT family N-acetyltransferase [Leptospirales bacterium]|jgi:RimJ/RimL family protein N-acetyltransferase